jgi:ATP-dependent Clp protease ATP-binding subunit ClpC
VFERFTERARQVVVLAQDEARSLGHDWIGTEHLLLGLLREEEGIAARVLESREITIENARARVVSIVGPGEGQSAVQIPFTPRAKKVLELSLREALSLGHNWIGTEHLLLGVVREGGGVAAVVLRDFGVPPGVIAEDVVTMLGGTANPEYVAQFSVGPAQETTSSATRTFTFGSIGRELPGRGLILGWFLFGVAVALGLLAGRLIWG